METDHHVHSERLPAHSLQETLDALRHTVARNLAIDPERLRYIDTGEPTVLGVTGLRWQIHYRGEWRDLPWHFDGPTGVTRELVRQWLGVADSEAGKEQ